MRARGGDDESPEARAHRKQVEAEEDAAQIWGQSLLHSLLTLANAGAAVDAALAAPPSLPAGSTRAECGAMADGQAWRKGAGGGGFDAGVSEQELRALLRATAQRYQDKGEWDRAAACAHFGGDLARVLCAAAERRALSASLVAQAPVLGLDAWAAASRLLAKQLEDKCFYHQAVAHLLACHQVVDAIEVYRRAGLWRDALALARARLPASSPVLAALWMSWGRALQARRLPGHAAQCFLRAGAPQAAVDVLVREALSLASSTAPSLPPTAWSARMALLRAASGLARALRLPDRSALVRRTACALLLRGAPQEAVSELSAHALSVGASGAREPAAEVGQEEESVGGGGGDTVSKALLGVAGATFLVGQILSGEEEGGADSGKGAGDERDRQATGGAEEGRVSSLWESLSRSHVNILNRERGRAVCPRGSAGNGAAEGGVADEESALAMGLASLLSDEALDAVERLMVEEGGKGRGGRAWCALAMCRCVLRSGQRGGVCQGHPSEASVAAFSLCLDECSV